MRPCVVRAEGSCRLYHRVPAVAKIHGATVAGRGIQLDPSCATHAPYGSCVSNDISRGLSSVFYGKFGDGSNAAFLQNAVDGLRKIFGSVYASDNVILL